MMEKPKKRERSKYSMTRQTMSTVSDDTWNNCCGDWDAWVTEKLGDGLVDLIYKDDAITDGYDKYYSIRLAEAIRNYMEVNN